MARFRFELTLCRALELHSCLRFEAGSEYRARGKDTWRQARFFADLQDDVLLRPAARSGRGIEIVNVQLLKT